MKRTSFLRAYIVALSMAVCSVAAAATPPIAADHPLVVAHVQTQVAPAAVNDQLAMVAVVAIKAESVQTIIAATAARERMRPAAFLIPASINSPQVTGSHAEMQGGVRHLRV